MAQVNGQGGRRQTLCALLPFISRLLGAAYQTGHTPLSVSGFP